MSAFSDKDSFQKMVPRSQDDEMFASSPVKLMLVILEFFQTDAEQTERMISASTNNELIELESLLKKPLNPNVRDEHGTAPLHCAAERGHVESLQLLIEAGADKNQATDMGATPLFMAALTGHLDVVQHLTEVGAHKDQATNNGANAIVHRSTGRPS